MLIPTGMQVMQAPMPNLHCSVIHNTATTDRPSPTCNVLLLTLRVAFTAAHGEVWAVAHGTVREKDQTA